MRINKNNNNSWRKPCPEVVWLMIPVVEGATMGRTAASAPCLGLIGHCAIQKSGSGWGTFLGLIRSRARLIFLIWVASHVCFLNSCISDGFCPRCTGFTGFWTRNFQPQWFPLIKNPYACIASAYCIYAVNTYVVRMACFMCDALLACVAAEWWHYLVSQGDLI